MVAWDAGAGRHIYRRDVDLAYTGNTVSFVGSRYDGHCDEVIDGRGTMVMPGLINVHTHPDVEPSYRGIREDHGVPQMYMTGLYERAQAYGSDHDCQLAAAEVAYCEMLLSGVTAVADLSTPYLGWSELAARSGLRVFLAPSFASARWTVPRPHILDYAWDEPAGRAGFTAALDLIEEVSAHPSGRLSGIIYPAQIDTCTEELLRDSAAAASEREIPITTHISQSVLEFQEMVRRHGCTPVQWAESLGLLRPGMILGHAIFIDEHASIRWWTRRDLALLADSGASVAHCPTTFARYGQTLEDFGRYHRAGVNLGVGTDCTPHNLIEELRAALVLGRVAAEDISAVSSADVMNAATIGGAAALLRDDLGRIAPGMKADFVVVNLSAPTMRPVRDPWRSLLYSAADRAVRDVYVDGKCVVSKGKVLTLDHADALDRLAEGQTRMERRVPDRDARGRLSQQISPLSLPLPGAEPEPA